MRKKEVFMIIGSFIVFVIFLLLFLSVLYFDRRNLFLGIFFIATGLSFIFYVMTFITNHAQDNRFFYNLGGNIHFASNGGSRSVFIQFIYAY